MSHYERLSVRVLDNVNAKVLQKAVKRMDASYNIKMTNQVTNAIKGNGNAVLMKGDIPTSIYFDIRTTKDGRHP